jgi:glycosyltransferase involved in cell wall biosynthesis
MKISVVIPTYNSAMTIQATLDSVLRQTRQPDEILVLDDGSKDNTIALLQAYGGQITFLQQKNQGVAAARNALSERAQGDLIAFLDHDDIWHPRYLEIQDRQFGKVPQAVAFFAGHVNFSESENFQWRDDSIGDSPAELIQPLDFLKRYNETTGHFGSMSFCCIPKCVLKKMGNAPFQFSGVDDSYLCTVLPLLGGVVYTPTKLVAYRLLGRAQSADRLKSLGLWVNVFEVLGARYRQVDHKKLRKTFHLAFALKRRRYGKLLMGADRTAEARRQFIKAVNTSWMPASALKSLALYLLTFIPSILQPKWPSSDRASGENTMNFYRSRRV